MATPKGSGIGRFDLGDWRDQVFAFDYDGTGKLDHLACYQPGTGTIWILKKVSDSPDAFAVVYHQGDPGQGIAGYNLADLRDQVFALITMALASSINWPPTGPVQAPFGS
jgi:hypothetical protein